MEELKKKGHDIKIKGIVVHQVVKQAHSTKCTLHLAKHAISPKEREKVFVANIKEAYYKKSNPTYGIFGNNDTSFQNLLLALYFLNLIYFGLIFFLNMGNFLIL